MAKILIIDTSILCVWLKIYRMDHAGPIDDLWDFSRIDTKINEEIVNGTTLVLPLATIIETGNHIAYSNGNRYKLAVSFCNLVEQTANNQTPWAAFTVQTELWEKENMIELARKWPAFATRKLSMGDATITDVADFYSKMGNEVEIFTGDAGLKALEPKPKSPLGIPRRNK